MKNHPKYLYRYRPLGIDDQRDDQELRSINDSYLWFATFDSLNDPTEISDAQVQAIPETVFSFFESLSKGLSEIPRVIQRRAEHAAKHFVPKENSGVCSFSEVHLHQAMWAYYANSFHGMCVKYDMQKLLSLSNFCWGNHPFPITYTEKKVISLLDKDPSFEYGDFHLSFTIKHPDWAHEKEWRLIEKAKSGKFYHTPNAIVGITLGPRINSAVAEKIRSICHAKEITFAEAQFQGNVLLENRSTFTSKNKKKFACQLSSRAESDRESLVAKGLDKNSLDIALQKLKSYPNAQSIEFFGVEDDGFLYVYISFNMPDGETKFKTVRFGIEGQKVSPTYEYYY